MNDGFLVSVHLQARQGFLKIFFIFKRLGKGENLQGMARNALSAKLFQIWRCRVQANPC